jgi:hypothetical protein
MWSRHERAINFLGRISIVAKCEENMTEETEVQEEEIQVAQEPQEVAETESKAVPEKPATNEQQINWQKANEVLKYQQQRIAELEARQAEMQRPVEPEKDEFADLEPDDYMPVGKAKLYAERIAEKKAKEAVKVALDEYSRKSNIDTDEARMRSKYEDYDYVIENFAAPQFKNDPALKHKIQNSKNPAETAYKLGKLSEDYEGVTMPQKTSPKAERILKNASRPVSGNAVGAPLKGQADEFSKMSKEEVWRMSQKYASQG